MNPEPSCYPSVNDPPPHCPVLLVTPPPTDVAGLVIPVDDGAIYVPFVLAVVGALALAMRWAERASRRWR